MAKSVAVNARKRDRPVSTGTGHVLRVRLLPEKLDLFDGRIAAHEPMSRPEAMRRILEPVVRSGWE